MAAALGALCRGNSAVAAQLRGVGGLQSLLSLLPCPAAPPKLRAAACEALRAAVAADSAGCDEVVRLGALPLLAATHQGGTQQVSDASSALLALMRERGSADLGAEIDRALSHASEGGAPNLIALLSAGRKQARRAALKIDHLAQASSEARDRLVELGAVPKLVKLLRLGPSDVGALNALGALEVLGQGHTQAQDEARECAVFRALIPLIRPADGAHDGTRTPTSGASPAPARFGAADDEGGGGGEAPLVGGAAVAPESAEEVRLNAALCLTALVHSNPPSRNAAKAAGAIDAIATLLDAPPSAAGGDGTEGHGETETAYVAAMALQALGYADEASQRTAVAPASQHDDTRPGGQRAAVSKRTGARVAALRTVWTAKEVPERWRR